MTTPALYISPSSGVPDPRLRGVHSWVPRLGWLSYLSTPLALVRLYGIETAILREPFGLDFKTWPDGSCENPATDKRQTIESYRNAVAQPVPEKITDLEELRAACDLLRAGGCEVIPYVGPPTRKDARGRILPVTPEYFAQHLGWVRQIGCLKVIVDGRGDHLATDIDEAATANGVHMLIEPCAMRSIPRHWCERASLTLSTTRLSNAYPSSDYAGTRWMVDTNGIPNDTYWGFFDQCTAAGFTMCLPVNPPIWDTWSERYADGQSHG